MIFKIKHRITRAVLFSLETGNMKLCVEAAVKAWADLAGAHLAGAHLAGAHLTGADLTWADFVAHLGYPDGWSAFAWAKDNQVRMQVGCRNFTIAEGRAYWAGKDNRREVMAALDYAERVAELRGWIKKDQAMKVA
ncbi:MAG: pentapeptide repeat-containing protein [Candidatus Acidiferrales bacterium]